MPSRTSLALICGPKAKLTKGGSNKRYICIQTNQFLWLTHDFEYHGVFRGRGPALHGGVFRPAGDAAAVVHVAGRIAEDRSGRVALNVALKKVFVFNSKSSIFIHCPLQCWIVPL